MFCIMINVGITGIAMLCLLPPEELENIIKSKIEHGMTTDVEERALKDFRWKDGESPIQKDFTPEPSDWAIEIDLKN